jgi:methylenetetrahydrofolate dehydrogenase (NADP+)/methenyltetrahydrofolate cyclohydrolase
MRLLNGLELTGFIKERQARQVRALRQAHKIIPRLAIIHTGNNPVNDIYMRLKQNYGADILIEVDIYNPADIEVVDLVKKLNDDPTVHGIVIQLPLADPTETELAVNSIIPSKDVDGLGENSEYVSATAMAIDWLLVGYNIDFTDKEIVIVGKGRLVGGPLAKLWRGNGLFPKICDSKTADLIVDLRDADIIVSATGVPGLIKTDMIKKGAVIVDAGTASENGAIIGDVDKKVRERDDITITPEKGGVGPLTIAALFDNVIQSAQKIVTQRSN